MDVPEWMVLNRIHFKIRDDSPTKEWKRIIKDGLRLDLNSHILENIRSR